MRLVSLLLIALLSSGKVAALSIVHPDGSGDYPTIQAAIDAIEPFDEDTLLLGDGVFTGAGNRDLLFFLVEVHLASLSGVPSACIIDTASEDVISQQTDVSTIHFSSIRFRNCGSLRPDRSSVFLTDCEFVSCSDIMALQWEASVECHSCLFTDCTDIGHGYADSGSGVGFYSCSFLDNHGGIGADAYEFYGCQFEGNANDSGPLLGVSGGDTYGGYLTVQGCLFVGNSSPFLIHYLNLGSSLLHIEDCAFIGNQGTIIQFDGVSLSGISASIRGCDFVGNRGEANSDIRIVGASFPNTIDIERSIFAFRQEGSAFHLDPSEENLQLIDCDIYGNSGGDWVGPIADQYGVGCNMSAHPQFCNWAAGDVSLYASSPCLPANNDCGVLIGADSLGCSDPTAVAPPGPVTPSLNAHPNPFNPSVRLNIALGAAVPSAHLGIYDPAGRRVAVLVDGPLPAGEHGLDWNAQGQASGVYLARLVTAEGIREIKLTLLR